MTKQKSKAQEPQVELPAAPAAGQAGQVVTGDGSGEALPEVSQVAEEQVSTAAQQPTTTEPLHEDSEPEDVIDAFVLCDGSLDGITRYHAGSVLQGVLESLAEANRHWLDTHPAAVEHALNSGAAVVYYEPES